MKLFVIKRWWNHDFLDDPLCLFAVYLLVFNATFNNRDDPFVQTLYNFCAHSLT
jgi:hypothetical protein